MSLVNGNVILKKAQNGKYAIGAYNFYNLETLKAILSASQRKNCDVIVQTSSSAIKYMEIETIVPMVKSLCKNLSIDVCLNLDHGKDFEIIKKCVDAGFSNVMIDASEKSFEENVELTKKCVEYAHKYGVTVEAELGSLKGVEDEISAEKSFYTDPKEALEFVKQTGIDSLAISIGTSHGAYKFAGKSHLDIDRLKEIKKLVDVPLVLHGASGVDEELKKNFVLSGGKIGNAIGVSNDNLIEAVKNGICKVNTDTDLRIAFTTGVRNSLKNQECFNPRDYLGEGMKEIEKEVEKRIDVLTSNKILYA